MEDLSQNHQNKKDNPVLQQDGQQSKAEEVDVTLIQWMLTLTPLERLQNLQRHLSMLERLKNGKFIH